MLSILFDQEMRMHIGEPTAALACVFEKLHAVDNEWIKNAPENGGVGGEEFLRRRISQLIGNPGFGRLQKYSSHLEQEVGVGHGADIDSGTQQAWIRSCLKIATRQRREAGIFDIGGKYLRVEDGVAAKKVTYENLRSIRKVGPQVPVGCPSWERDGASRLVDNTCLFGITGT